MSLFRRILIIVKPAGVKAGGGGEVAEIGGVAEGYKGHANNMGGVAV